MIAGAMTPEQKIRSGNLYEDAFFALALLSEERLNLSVDTRDALNVARGALEAFDALRLAQPTTAPQAP